MCAFQKGKFGLCESYFLTIHRDSSLSLQKPSIIQLSQGINTEWNQNYSTITPTIAAIRAMTPTTLEAGVAAALKVDELVAAAEVEVALPVFEVDEVETFKEEATAVRPEGASVIMLSAV